MMTFRQTILLGSAYVTLAQAIDQGTQSDRDAALVIVREHLTMVAELETVEKATVATTPEEVFGQPGEVAYLDDNCG